MSFSTSATVNARPAPLSENRIALDDAIQSLQPQGKTAIYDGLLASKQVLDDLPPAGDDRIRAIVLLSDGQSKAGSATFEQVSQAFEESGISIFPVACGSDADEQQLQQIVDFSRTMLVKGGSGNIGQIFDQLSRYF